MIMNKVEKIEAITKDILAGYYGTTQNCGTETQKYTYAFLALELDRNHLRICPA